MRAGKLPYLVTIEQRSTGQDAGGGMLNSWSTFATVWAGAIALNGRELEAAQARNNEISHKWTLRGLPGLTAQMRINWAGNYYNILWIDDVALAGREMFVYTSSGLVDL